MEGKFDQLRIKIIHGYLTSCFFSTENLKNQGQYLIEKFKNQHASLEHKQIADELQDLIFNNQLTTYVRTNAAILLRLCMDTKSPFLQKYVEQNTIEHYGRIVLLIKNQSQENKYFLKNALTGESEHITKFLNEIMVCIHQWQGRSHYFESVYQSLMKHKISFASVKASPSISPQINIPQSLPKLTSKDRVRIKIGFLKDTLHFFYQCFVLTKMYDGISEILLSCNDLMQSINMEKELLKTSGDNSDVLNRIQKLQQLLTHMNQDYTRGEPITKYVDTYQKVLIGVLDINPIEEDEKIKQAYNEEFSSSKSENLIRSLASLNQIDLEIIPKRSSNKAKSLIFSAAFLDSSFLGSYSPHSAAKLQSISSGIELEDEGMASGNIFSEGRRRSWISKKQPLIYGKLQELKSETLLPKSPSIKKIIIENDSPDYKQHSMTQDTASPNGSNPYRSYSLESSRESSPVMFSTSEPLFFKQLYPSTSSGQSKEDSVMDEEKPTKSKSKSRTFTNITSNATQKVQKFMNNEEPTSSTNSSEVTSLKYFSQNAIPSTTQNPYEQTFNQIPVSNSVNQLRSTSQIHSSTSTQNNFVQNNFPIGGTTTVPINNNSSSDSSEIFIRNGIAVSKNTSCVKQNGLGQLGHQNNSLHHNFRSQQNLPFAQHLQQNMQPIRFIPQHKQQMNLQNQKASIVNQPVQAPPTRTADQLLKATVVTQIIQNDPKSIFQATSSFAQNPNFSNSIGGSMNYLPSHMSQSHCNQVQPAKTQAQRVAQNKLGSYQFSVKGGVGTIGQIQNEKQNLSGSTPINNTTSKNFMPTPIVFNNNQPIQSQPNTTNINHGNRMSHQNY